MKETAWESPLLVEAIWGKQGCILCLLVNTILPWIARKQNFAGENVQNELEEEMKENSSTSPYPHQAKNDQFYCHKEHYFLFFII